MLLFVSFFFFTSHSAARRCALDLPAQNAMAVPYPELALLCDNDRGASDISRDLATMSPAMDQSSKLTMMIPFRKSQAKSIT